MDIRILGDMHMKEYTLDFMKLVEDINPGQKVALLLEGNGSKGNVSQIEPFFTNFKEKYIEFKKSIYYPIYMDLKEENFETIEKNFENTERFLNSPEDVVQEVNKARNDLLETETRKLTMHLPLNRKRTIALYEAILDKTDNIDLFGGDYRKTPIENLVSYMYTYKLKVESDINKELEKEHLLKGFNNRFVVSQHRYIAYGFGFAAKCKELKKDNYDFAYHIVGTRHWIDIENGCKLFNMEADYAFMPEEKDPSPREVIRKKSTKIFLKYAKRKIGKENLYELVKKVRDGKIPVSDIVENL